jgi:hypothetical protein
VLEGAGECAGGLGRNVWDGLHHCGSGELLFA